jgi:hypothetical protein
MVCLTLRRYVPNGGIELDKLTVAEGFMQVLAHLDLEYDLPPDIWAVAEDVLQALKARETNWTEKLARDFCENRDRSISQMDEVQPREARAERLGESRLARGQ